MSQPLPFLFGVVLLLGTAACGAAPGDTRTSASDGRPDEAPTGSILPGASTSDDPARITGTGLQSGTGNYNSAFHAGLR